MSEVAAIRGGKPVREKERFLLFGAPDVQEDDITEVVDSLRKNWIGTGPKVVRFERDFGNYIGATQSVAVHSCTAALHLSLLALGIGPGDEVITTPLTFCATINAILHAGAIPILADCDLSSMNLDPSKVEKKISSRTKAILPVHFAGRPCNMPALLNLSKEKRLLIIEDCAHAIESEIGGQHMGTFGDVGCFSFYATKNLTTAEGGMILAKSKEVSDRLKRLALHGLSHDAWKRYSDQGFIHYDVVELGYKYNMTDLQASLGIHQLKRIEENWFKRKKIWARYQSEFSQLPCVLPAGIQSNEKHAFHLYTPLIDIDSLGHSRDWVATAMTREGIGIGVHYRAVFEHPYYQQKFQWKAEDYPNASYISQRTLSLPLSPALKEGDVEDVITAFNKVLNIH